MPSSINLVTFSDLAAELARQSGKSVTYSKLPEAEYEKALLGFGLPPVMSHLLVDSDVGASQGGLFDDGHQLSTLIRRPTTSLAKAVSRALADATSL